jgi:hypothetical protein
LSRFSAEKIRDVHDYWVAHPWASPVQVAKEFGASDGPIHKHYPFPRPLGDEDKPVKVRHAQWLRAFKAHPGLSDEQIAKATGLTTKVADSLRREHPLLVLMNEMEAPPANLQKVEESSLEPVAEEIKPTSVEADGWPPSNTTAKMLTKVRADKYGHPLDNFRRIAAGKLIISECKDPEVRHALDEVWVKVCRLIETPDHVDSIDDIGGYAETIHMIHAEREVRDGRSG